VRHRQPDLHLNVGRTPALLPLYPRRPEKGLPHVRNVKISNINAVDAQRAFLVSSYKNSPLKNFKFKNLKIDAKSAGSIQYADHWTFVNTHIKTTDGSVVKLEDCGSVTGLEEK
jgi:hypothetical protein